MYSLRTAAEAAGVGKPAILKAIQKGRISATKGETGRGKLTPPSCTGFTRGFPEPLPELVPVNARKHR